jgi:hypothetical protein
MLSGLVAGFGCAGPGAVHPVHFINRALSVILYVMYSIPLSDEPFPGYYKQLITTGGDGASTD